MKLKIFLPLAVFAATFGIAANFQTQAQEAMEAPLGADDPFNTVTEAMRAEDYALAKKLLLEMKAKGLEPLQYSRWETFASRAALRGNDIEWLREINKTAGLSENANELLLLAAMRSIFSADFKQARVLLECVDSPEKLPEIPRRRYLQLYQRLEQATGNPQKEKLWAEKMVNFASEWNDQTCRTCHDNNRKHKGKVTTFDYANWWTGKRWVELLKSDGSAKTELYESQAALQKNPADQKAQLRMAYALRALGKEDEAKKQFATIPWAKVEGREYIKPLRLQIWP